MGEAKRKFKTKRELTASCLYRGYEEWSVGDIVIGKIVDFRKDSYGNMGIVIHVEDCQFNKDAKKFQDKKLYLNSCGTVKGVIDELSTNDVIQVEYKGKVVTQKGKFAGKDRHDLAIQVLEEDDGSESSEEESDL